MTSPAAAGHPTTDAAPPLALLELWGSIDASPNGGVVQCKFCSAQNQLVPRAERGAVISLRVDPDNPREIAAEA